MKTNNPINQSPVNQNPKTMVIIYTDGSCIQPQGKGGWAAILKSNSKSIVISCSAINTTSNRMEMTAAIKALQKLKYPCEVKLHSDSQLLVNTMTLGWKRKANQDLWAELDRLAKIHEIEWIWVKGHSNDRANNFVDKLANRAARTASSLVCHEISKSSAI